MYEFIRIIKIIVDVLSISKCSFVFQNLNFEVLNYSILDNVVLIQEFKDNKTLRFNILYEEYPIIRINHYREIKIHTKDLIDIENYTDEELVFILGNKLTDEYIFDYFNETRYKDDFIRGIRSCLD